MAMARRGWLLTAAAILAAILVASVALSRLMDAESETSLLGWGCTDPTICSKWSLLRTKRQHQVGPEGAGSALPAPQISTARGRHGRRRGGSHSLLTSPFDAAASIFRRERNIVSKTPPTSSVRGSRKQQQRAAPPLVGHPSHEAGLDLRAGSVLHVDTAHGRLPLVVDSAPDAEGDVSVHGFREGLRYEGAHFCQKPPKF